MLKEVGISREFFISPYGKIIRTCDDAQSCPIIAMYDDLTHGKINYGNGSYVKAAGVLHIPYLEAVQIAEAADYKNHPYRKHLMKHLGIKENKN